ncbi:TonB-linked outer membrane protein, SusC/RagA family [Chitinophaga rupis]|uniref:TonB-linked outer membrane protein, SusC/RagA family n=1 Tax=Chitinophaga rupis TaxID=573321 RepID=A0A1H8HZH1_9BACT|nr:TonB-dependent receptor [Chitinophaga rupis]SEN61643.1 TonB-linked outer membrane protein, SusC/RagA family [Chitinophaga rupis]
MKNVFHKRCSGRLFFLGCCLCFQQAAAAQDLSWNSHGEQRQGKTASKSMLLTEALSNIASRYHVTFDYDSEALQQKQVTAEKVLQHIRNNRQYTTLDTLLKDLLSPFGMKVKQFGSSSYTIYIPGAPPVQRLNSTTAPAAPLPADTTIQGRIVSAADGQPLPGVSVLVKGSNKGAVSDADGVYHLQVPDHNAILLYQYIGFDSRELAATDKATAIVALSSGTSSLSEVVVTGYTTQQKKDITGSVAVVNTKDLLSVPAGNFGQQLQGRAAGVTVTSNAAPGAGVSMRIRGIGTINDNGPLYVIDGVSTRSQSLNSLNPNDIESIQVLKDAASASIYGAQASNGVVIITTKKGKAGVSKISYDAYYGMQYPGKGPDLLNTNEWANLIWTGLKNAGQVSGNGNPNHPQFGNGAQPVVPYYILPAGKAQGTVDESKYDLSTNQIVKANQAGTNWYKEIFAPASIQNHQLTGSGGSDKGNYAFGLNYFNQQGILKYTNFKRYSARINTALNVKEHIRFGENLQVSFTESTGGDYASGEGNAIVNAMRLPPIIPVYDIDGNFAGTRGAGLGNASNPYAMLYRGKDNKTKGFRAFGNAYTEITLLKGLQFKSSFGIDYTNSTGYSFSYLNPEHSEPAANNSFNESSNYNLRWVFTNTLNYKRNFGYHSLNVLLGTEAISENGRNLKAGRFNYFSTSPLVWDLNNGDPSTQTNGSNRTQTALASMFGRVDYAYHDKYLFTGILRRDGVSRFAPDHRYGIFPAASVGWRLSEEPFLKSVTWIDELKLRAGVGATGNQEIPRAYNYAYEYGTSPGTSNYDLGGTSNSTVIGYYLANLGNPETVWESTVMTNIGLDLTILNGRMELNAEVYDRRTNGMLTQPQLTALAGRANAPFVNIGDMKNTGIDLNLNYHDKIGGDLRYEVGVTFSHYKNEVLRLGDSGTEQIFSGGTRYGTITLTQKGQPVSMFYGYQIEGIFQNENEVKTHALQTGMDKNNPAKFVGKYKLKDVNGDGVVTLNDRTFIGNPHPDFTYGFNLSLAWHNFDLNLYLYGSQGNDIYNITKYYTDFQTFAGNRSKRMLYDSWRPDNPNAKLPILDANDNISNGISHSYYIENGSYLRAKNLQIGYTLPASLLKKAKIDQLRLYVQATNLFTITGYSGLDPDIMNADFGGSGDLNKGVDYGFYPNSRQVLVGISLTF